MFCKTFAFLMTCLSSLPNQGDFFNYIIRELFILNLLVSFCLWFWCLWFWYQIKCCKKEREPFSFILRFALLITAPTRYGQTHTNAQMSPAGCTCQKVWRDKKWWKAPYSNKRKFPWRNGSFLDSVRRKVMKHLSRRNVRPNQGSCGQQRNARIIKLTSLT